MNADNLTVNAKVDYTLLDRWRHSQAWRTRRRLHENAASAAGAESNESDASRRDERDLGARSHRSHAARRLAPRGFPAVFSPPHS